MSIFDPDSFMNDTTTESNDTAVAPIPPGEYQAQIAEVNGRVINGKDGERAVLDVTYEILDEAIKSELGRQKLTVRQTVWLDLNSNGRIDSAKGKNVGLGKLRAAADLNDAGKPFAPPMLVGSVVKVITGLRADRNDPTIQYADVKTVGKAA